MIGLNAPNPSSDHHPFLKIWLHHSQP
jgi:hypothetical protein